MKCECIQLIQIFRYVNIKMYCSYVCILTNYCQLSLKRETTCNELNSRNFNFA